MTNRPKNILYVAEFATGGSIESLLCLVRALDKSEYAPTVLFFAMPESRTVERFQTAGARVDSLYPYSPAKTGQPDFKKRSLQKHVRKYFGERIEQLYASAKYALFFKRFRLNHYRAMRTRFAELQPDIIHFNNDVHIDTAGILASRKLRIPTICHVRAFTRLTFFNTSAARDVARFVCISAAIQQSITEFGISRARCTVVPNAVDRDIFKVSDRSRNSVRQDLGLLPEHTVFVLAGRVVEWKGHVHFVRAIAAARERCKSIAGVIVGDAGPGNVNAAYMKSLHDLVEELDLRDSVKFSGHRTDVADIMNACDVSVCASSKPEPFGRVIIESMSLGTPVIATAAGGAAEIVNDSRNGLLVPAADSDAMADAMVRLATDKGLDEALGKQGLTDFEKYYTVASHVSAIQQVYRDLLEQSG